MEAFLPQGAESAMVDFFEAWRQLDKKRMFESSQITWRETHKEAWLRTFLVRRIYKYEIKDPVKIGDYAIDFSVSVNDGPCEKVRIICETAPYTPGNGSWGVNPISALKLIKDI
jgi:hypothetical protein